MSNRDINSIWENNQDKRITISTKLYSIWNNYVRVPNSVLE